MELEAELDLGLSILSSSADFAHNVSFPAKLGNFSEIIFYQNGSVWCVNSGIGLKFD